MLGLPDYATGLLFKKEFIGLRPVLNVDFRNFDAGGLSLYEIEFTGSSGNFAQVVNNTVIKPLNAKLGNKAFKLLSHHGEIVKLSVDLGPDPSKAREQLKTMPPASLSAAAPERIKELIKDKSIMDKVVAMNPSLKDSLNTLVSPVSGQTGQSSLEDF